MDPLVGLTGEPYAFTGGDPLNLTDPLGLMFTCGGHAGACAGGPSTGPILEPSTSTTASSASSKGSSSGHGGKSGSTHSYMICGNNQSCYTNQPVVTQQMMAIAQGNLTYVGPGSMSFADFSGNDPWKSLAGSIAGIAAPLTPTELAPYLARGSAAFSSALAPTVGRVVLSGGMIFGVATGTDAVDLPAQPDIVAQVLQNLELSISSEDEFWQQEIEATFHADILPPEITSGQKP